MLELLRLDAYKCQNPNELTIQQLQKIETALKHPERKNFDDEILDFKLWCMGLPSRQEKFAEYLSKRLPKEQGLKVLEVGCGRTARLSRLLAKNGYVMTCIDPELDLSYCTEVKGIKGKFNYKKIDLSPYDYIVAQEPCDATEHIVRACVQQNKPFMISLCGTAHKMISGETPKDYEEWYQNLINISPESMKLRYLKLDPLSITPLLKSK